MKFRTTNKEIKQWHRKVYRIGYGAAQSLLSKQEPIAYTCGVYGWNADVYEIEGVAIVTGYRPGVGASVDYDLLNKYEKKAEKIRNNFGLSYEQQKKKINKLLNEFIKALEEGEQQ